MTFLYVFDLTNHIFFNANCNEFQAIKNSKNSKIEKKNSFNFMDLARLLVQSNRYNARLWCILWDMLYRNQFQTTLSQRHGRQMDFGIFEVDHRYRHDSWNSNVWNRYECLNNENSKLESQSITLPFRFSIYTNCTILIIANSVPKSLIESIVDLICFIATRQWHCYYFRFDQYVRCISTFSLEEKYRCKIRYWIESSIDSRIEIWQIEWTNLMV